MDRTETAVLQLPHPVTELADSQRRRTPLIQGPREKREAREQRCGDVAKK